MALMPKRVKYRKSQRRSRAGIATRGYTLAFGEFGLQCLENGWITNIQIEAARVALTRHVRRGGRIYIRIFPDKPVTKKPAETRQGKGKGEPEKWVAVVHRGKVLVEMEGIPQDLARTALRLASAKLPLRTRFVAREEAAA
ncbi:MAG: 50S ribosomal protein L16 [Candidatus Omnitrophica bacterium]|nr:50S ribosomal protein L16 [Candidatus Omnitrophota bacterium]